jgi:hypothetical protein
MAEREEDGVVVIEWPHGTRATFDGQNWASTDSVWSGAELESLPVFVSVMLDDYLYWHAVDVAEQVGARVVTPAPGPLRLQSDIDGVESDDDDE